MSTGAGEVPVAHRRGEHASCGAPSSLSRLQELIDHAAHLLPTQGPITVFVHHNTLHAFEDLPFAQAVLEGAKRFGYEPYLPEERYREELESGRIREEDLSAVLVEDLGDYADGLIGFLGTRFHLRLAMLRYPLRMATGNELRWFVAETDALKRFRGDASGTIRSTLVKETRRWVMRDLRVAGDLDDAVDVQIRQIAAELFEHCEPSTIEDWSQTTWESFSLHLLWRVCHLGAESIRDESPASLPVPVRHRDVLLAATGEDCDLLVHEFLLPFCAAYLDQGLASWGLPDRELGFYRAFCELYRQPGGPPREWLRGLKHELDRQHEADLGPLESIAESLELFGIDEGEAAEFITATLLALPGWAGMIWQMETNAEWTVHPAPRESLLGFLAVRLILDRLAAESIARQYVDSAAPLCDIRRVAVDRIPTPENVRTEQRAFLVFQLSQVLGWNPQDLYRLSPGEWFKLLREIEAFPTLDRRRIYQLAYERRYRCQALDAIAAHARRASPLESVPDFQVVCCIDDREESFRRHLEEVAPECETFGAAGFYAVAMYYRGAADACYRPLCPVIIKPQHYVCEEVFYSFEGSHRRRTETRRALGAASLQWHVSSRDIFGGVLTAFVGSLASIPMVARILFPRTTARIRQLFSQMVQPPRATQLQLERSNPEPGPHNGQIGYTIEEMTDIVERILRDIGLLSDFSRLVIFVGHGSSSLNNPHESAYNCGACSGGPGGPNARAFAQMANDPRVREHLKARGLSIPGDTAFLGAFHNSCDDSMTYFDLDRLPVSHRPDFEQARDRIDTARERNAQERCRRFESAELTLSPEEALRHVEARAEDLSQARPEYNHATNALCFVGRRWRTRGLFMDRRAFLASYDPEQDDPGHNLLLRILTPAVPVCAGISLEYYFSTVDVTGWGCGSKLPHNITALLGVMEGAAGDLRPGLSAQMVEIHEPMRILFVVETTPDAMQEMMDLNPEIGRLCRNEWVQVATLDPHSSRIDVYDNGRFQPYRPHRMELPEVRTSIDWFRGWRDNLGFAAVKDGLPAGDRHKPSHTPVES